MITIVIIIFKNIIDNNNNNSFVNDEYNKNLWDFEIQTDHLISARRPDLVIVNKKQNCHPGRRQGKTERK